MPKSIQTSPGSDAIGFELELQFSPISLLLYTCLIIVASVCINYCGHDIVLMYWLSVKTVHVHITKIDVYDLIM